MAWLGADCLISGVARACALVAMAVMATATGGAALLEDRHPEIQVEPVVADFRQSAPFFPPWERSGKSGEFASPDELHPGETVPLSGVVAAAGISRVNTLGGSLSEAEMRAILADVGWQGIDLEEALRVSWGESRWSPYAAGDNVNSLGLFQLNRTTWPPYCGIGVEALYDARENAKCALAVFRYEQARGYPRWANWSVKP